MEPQESQKESGEEIVQEMIDEIIEKVQLFNEWDITDKGKQIETKQRSGKSLNLISLICDHTPSRILVNYTLKDVHVHVLQLKCTEQKASGYCGHYAVHNALCVLEACHSLNEKDAIGYINETDSVVSYWRRYWQSISHLLIRARNEGAWPWTEDYVYTGDMERSFLRYLMKTDLHLNRERDNIIVLQYSYGLFQHTFESISQIQDKLDHFSSSPCPAPLVFILGVTNHWLALIAYKSTKEACPCDDKCGCGQINVIYMDSNNVPVPALSDKGIADHMIKQEKERISIKGRGYPNWKRNVIRQAYVDQRCIVDRIARYVSGQITLREEFVHEYIDKMLSSFECEITEKCSESIDLYVPLLLNWLDGHYPVQILNETLTPFLACKDKLTETLNPLCKWANDNLCHVACVQSGITQIDSFTVLLTTISDLLL